MWNLAQQYFVEDNYLLVICEKLLITISAIDFNETTVDEWIIDAETESIDNFINRSETMDGSFAIDVLFDFFGFLFLPRCIDESWDDGIDSGARAFELFHEIFAEGMDC